MTFGRIRRLIVSGAILFSVITVQAQPGKILSVTDFGAVANSGRDATPAFRRALIACGNNRARILRFGKGRYDLYPDSALKREYFISNTSSEAECPSKVKTIGLLLERLHGLSLEGDETLLVFHGKMTPFVLDHCRSIRIRNLSVDFARPTMSEFTILQATADSIDVRVHPDSWYRLEKGKLVWYGEGWIQENYHCIRVDSRDGTMRYANDAYGQLMKASVREISPGRLRFTGHFIPRDFPPGNRFTVRDPVRDQVGGFIAYCRDITLDHLNLYYMHGLGIVSQYSENLHMNVIRVEPAPHSGRKIASFADALHFSGCRGQILIENCRFNGMHDDPVNIHGTHLRIIRQTAPDQLIVRFMHGQTYGFDAFFENDSVAFVHAATLQTYHFARVQRAIRLSDRDIQLTFREPVPSGRQDGDVLENI
ncbi:MAG TPA: hypothetical protein VG870_14840, partial [Chitinophagaceae bacterium]|nr:hypothetical protein [Chitinophagaceae bacterium]